MNEYIKSDIYRYTGKTSLGAVLKGLILCRSFRHQVLIRLSNDKGLKGKVARVLYYINRYLNKNMQISFRCEIGYGFYVGHDGPIVVSRYTKFGCNVNISQFTTIGTNNEEGATIGDNVYIGPSVCIVGGVKIGNNVTIGAGSVVTKDIPDGATVAGNPARVLNYKSHSDFIQNKWVMNGEGARK